MPHIVRVPLRLKKSILPIPPRPGFPADVKGVWRFDEVLDDAVGTNDFVPNTETAVYTLFSKYELIHNTLITRSGLAFEEDKIYTASNSYAYSQSWTIAFWWHSPGLVGFTRHATTRELESKVAPLFAIGDSQKTASQTNVSNASVILTEVGDSKTKNAVRVYLITGGDTVSHVITSKPYSAPGLHHILVTYIRTQKRFRIDIDGETGILHSAPGVSLQRTGKLRINDIVPGFLAHKTTQTGGYMFDLLFTTYASTDNESLKMFRYGYEHITEETLFDARFAYFGLAYSQPSTVSTSHIFVDGGNIFAAQSDGRIVKGARPIWDKEANYPNTQSVALLNTSKTDGESRTIEWTTGGLKLKGVSVTI